MSGVNQYLKNLSKFDGLYLLSLRSEVIIQNEAEPPHDVLLVTQLEAVKTHDLLRFSQGVLLLRHCLQSICSLGSERHP